jgi:hypothetical protein
VKGYSKSILWDQSQAIWRDAEWVDEALCDLESDVEEIVFEVLLLIDGDLRESNPTMSEFKSAG